MGGLVTGIDHVGIAVAELEAATELYASVFGFVVSHVEDNEQQGVREAMLRASDDRDGVAIQLLAPLTTESAIAKFLDRSGPGLQQLALRVTDIDSACVRLRDKGLRVLYDHPVAGTEDSRINFVHPKDAGGVLVELVEPAR